MTTTTTTIPTTTWNQIPVSTKMSCGLRSALAVSKTELRMKALRQNRWVLVNLDPSDTYTVRLVRQERKTYRLITIEEIVDVYAEDLGETIYGMCHGAGRC